MFHQPTLRLLATWQCKHCTSSILASSPVTCKYSSSLLPLLLIWTGVEGTGRCREIYAPQLWNSWWVDTPKRGFVHAELHIWGAVEYYRYNKDRCLQHCVCIQCVSEYSVRIDRIHSQQLLALKSYCCLCNCSGSGRIVDIYATDFEALADQGEIVVVVQNTGNITADFSVRLDVCMLLLYYSPPAVKVRDDCLDDIGCRCQCWNATLDWVQSRPK